MKDYIAGETKWRLPSQGDLPPTGAKCLILTAGGVCVVGAWGQGCVAWAPLPKMHDEVRNALDSADIKQWPRTMNERIKRLAEQAGMTDDKYGMFFAKDKHNEHGVDLEEFAELIVAECCEVADTLHLYPPTMTAEKLIARHFGFESYIRR